MPSEQGELEGGARREGKKELASGSEHLPYDAQLLPVRSEEPRRLLWATDVIHAPK